MEKNKIISLTHTILTRSKCEKQHYKSNLKENVGKYVTRKDTLKIT